MGTHKKDVIKYGDYWVTKKGDDACATWFEYPEGQNKKRRRVALGMKMSEPNQVLRAALVAFVHEKQSLQLRSQLLVPEIIQAYIDDKEEENKDMSTERYRLKRLETFFGQVKITDVNVTMCRAYAKAQQQADYAKWSIHGDLSTLRSAEKWAFDNHLIDRRPPTWTPKKPPSRTATLKPEQVSHLFGTLTTLPQLRARYTNRVYDYAHLRVFLWLAILTGARKSAILELRWDQIDFDSNTIDYNEDDIHEEFRDILDKSSKKGRSVQQMSTLLREVLHEAYLTARSTHVVERNGRPVRSIDNAWRSLRDASDLEGYTIHDMRRTVATWAREHKVPMETIAEVLGHEDPKTTRDIYAQQTGATTRDAVETVANLIKPKLRVVGED